MKSRWLCLSAFSLISLFVTAPSTWAARAPDYTIHQEYTSTRALGMGNAFTAVVDDHSALFYNPAALAFRKDTQLRLMLRAGADKDVMDFADEVDKADGDPNAMNAVIQKYYGDHLYFRAPTIGGILARPKWSLAIIPVDFSVDLAPKQTFGPGVFVNAYLDTTIAFGRGSMIKMPWFNKKKYPMAFGWTAKVLHRAFYSDIISSAQLATGEDLVNIDRAAEGATFDMDVGVLYNFKVSEKAKIKPTVGAVIRNVLDYGFPTNFEILNKDPKEPPKLERRLDLGSKFALPKWWVFDPKVAVDMRDIGHRNWTPMKGFHAGAELYWKVKNWWKGHWSVGMNQGYWTAGFGARLAIFQLDLASWGEEVGTTDSKKESRRYILEMSLDF